MRTTKSISSLWLFLSTTLLASCIADSLDTSLPTGDGETTTVRVKLQMPSSVPRTYSISEIDENHVETVDVLAFMPDATKASGWAFAYHAEGQSIIDLPGDNPVKAKKQFNVTLNKDNDRDQCLVLLVNVRAQLATVVSQGMAVGADKDALLARFEFENAGSWNANINNSKPEGAPDRFLPFPMWGEIEERITNATSQIGTVGLLRAIARLDVVLGSGVVSSGNFLLDKIYVYNSKNKGRIVPAPANRESLVKVIAATPPIGSINNATPLEYLVPDDMRTVFERTIYLFEARAVAQNKPEEATCLVVEGTYGSDTQPTYYRLDFFQGDRKTYRDVLRNHHYRVNINSVSDRGYNTPEEAFDSRTSNMIAEVREWDDGDMGDVVFGGQYMLAISRKVFEFVRNAQTDDVFIETDYDVQPNAGWKAISSDNWLTIVGLAPSGKGSVTTGNLQATGNPSVKLKLTFTVAENTTGQDRETTLRVTAGRLTQVITIRQSIEADVSLEIVDPDTGGELAELAFAGKSGTVPAAREFTVQWSPSIVSPAMNVSRVGSYEFVFNNNYDVITPGTLPGGTGEKTYTVQPAQMDPAILAGNPFAERISKVSFIVSNGESFESESIILRQMVYGLRFKTEEAYLMDGQEHVFGIRINYPWRAELLDNGNGAVANLLTTTGNPKTTADIPVRFNTVYDLTNPATPTRIAKVRFYHAADATVYEDVELLCVAGIVQEESNSYVVKPGGAGILIPVSRANASNLLPIGIGADDLFQAELVWTDHPGGVKSKANKGDAAIDRILVAGKGQSGYILVLPGQKEGNSVVAVKVNNDTKWSWHIWTTIFNPNNAAQWKAYNGYQFMDRQLGALTGYTANTQNDYSKSGMLYQWGRKDPIPGGAGLSATDPVLYNEYGVSSNARIARVNGGSLALSVGNPSTYYFRTNEPCDWYSTTTGGQNSRLWLTADFKKTIYDPCPKGWRVPYKADSSSPFASLTTGNSTGWNKGRTWTSLGYFPDIFRESSAGGTVTTTLGYTWSATLHMAVTSRSLALAYSSSRVDPAQHRWRSHAYHVRCVRE